MLTFVSNLQVKMKVPGDETQGFEFINAAQKPSAGDIKKVKDIYPWMGP
jgi:hypothetical protein